MSGAFGKCEGHDIVISRACYGCVVGPIISKVMDKLALMTRKAIDHCLTGTTIWVVWGSDKLNVWSILIVEGMCITLPFV